MKKIMALCLVVVLSCSGIANATMVKIVSVKRTSWSVATGQKEVGAGGKAIGAGAGLWLLGPVGLAAGLYMGHNSDKNNAKVETTQVEGYLLKLSNGESVKTLKQYNVGQKIDRIDIEEEM